MQGQDIAAAMAAFRRGDLSRARTIIEEQLKEADGSAVLHHLMGLIECRQNQFESGIGWLKRALDLDPANVGYRLVLARALIDGGRPRDALDLTAGNRLTVELWQVRAEAAFAAGERGIESDAWTQLCKATPRAPLLWINLGRSLLAQSRFEEAESAYRRALALDPRNVPAFHELGLTLERTNRIDELAKLLEAALALGIAKEVLAEVWALLELRRRRAEEAQRLLRNPPQDADPVRWNHLRARAFDATGDAGAAFDAATQMNRSVRQYATARNAAAGYRERLAALARLITPEWGARLPRLSV